MGRSKEFCVEGALARALEVFWRHGFEGASLTELTAAMGITRPSLYAAYGNKEELFRKALDLYDELYMGFAREALDESRARDVAARILAGFVEVGTGGGHPRGCLGTNGALVCSSAAEPIRDELIRRRGHFEATLRRRLERAIDEGDLPSGESPADLARFVMTTAGGIAVQAAGGASHASLNRVVELAMRAWPDDPDAARRTKVQDHAVQNS